MIVSYAFYGSQITVLSLPRTLTGIGDQAFSNNPITRIVYCGDLSLASFNFPVAPVCANSPSAPTITLATVTGATKVRLALTPPTSDGGLAINTYTAIASPGGARFTGTRSEAGNLDITGLTPNTAYTFTVRANNDAGPSPASVASSQVTTLSSPLVPEFGNVTATPNNYSAQISNYDPGYTWSGVVVGEGTVTITNTGLVRVVGVSTGSRSRVVVTAAKLNFESGSARFGNNALFPVGVYVQSWNSSMYVVDPETGNSRVITTETFPGNGAPGFDIDAARGLAYQVSYDNPSRIYTLNLSTGRYNESSILLPARYCRGVDLAGDGTLWVACDTGDNNDSNVLIKVNVASSSSLQVGGAGQFRPTGLASDPLTGTLYVYGDSGERASIDLATGAWTRLTNNPVTSCCGSADFTEQGDLYWWNYSGGPLVITDSSGTSRSITVSGIYNAESMALGNADYSTSTIIDSPGSSPPSSGGGSGGGSGSEQSSSVSGTVPNQGPSGLVSPPTSGQQGPGASSPTGPQVSASQMRPQMLQALDPTSVRQISLSVMSTFTATQFAMVPAKAVAGLTLAQINALTPSALAGLNGDQLRALSRKQFKALTPAQVNKLRPEVFKSMSRDQLATITPELARTLSVKQLGALRPSVVWAIPRSAYRVMTWAQQNAMKQAAGWFS